MLESGSHPLAYLQAPVSSRWFPPLRSFRSSGHKDPEQPGACVPQSARAKRFSRLTKREKGQRRATRMLVKIQFLGTSVPKGSDSSSVLLPSSFAWQRVTQGPGSPWQPLLLFALPDRSNLRRRCHTARPSIHSPHSEEAWQRQRRGRRMD